MMSANPILNRAHQQAWYSRLKQDPERWRDYIAKKKAYKQAVRDGVRSPKLSRKGSSISRRSGSPDPVSVGGELAVPKPVPKPVRRFLSKECAQELFDERSSIMEFDGGVARGDAESRVLAWLVQHFTGPAKPKVCQHQQDQRNDGELLPE